MHAPAQLPARRGENLTLTNFVSYQYSNDLMSSCSDSWDHVPIRSWLLFKARRVLRTLLTTDKPLLTS